MRYLLICTAVLGLACSKSESSAPTAPEPQPELGAATEEPAQAVDAEPEAVALPSLAAPSVQLVAPGEPPHRALRWSVKKGLKETVKVRRENAMTMANGVAPSPPIIYEVALTTKDVAAGRSAQVGFEITNVEVPENPTNLPSETFEALKQRVKVVQGKTATYELDSRGVISKFQFDPGQSIEAGFQGLGELLIYGTTVPLPEEEVGQGATWTVKRVVEESGVRIEEVSTVELVKLEGSRISLNLKLERTAPRQVLTDGPGVPPGGLTVLGVKAVGTAAGQWDLTALSPSSSKAEAAETKTFLKPGPDGLEEPIEVRQDTVMVMTRK